MQKININITIITNGDKQEYNLLGEYDLNKKCIKYLDNDNLNTSMLLDIENEELIRENEAMKMNISFKKLGKADASIYVREIEKRLNLSINIDDKSFKENAIRFSYTILDSNDKITYIIKW